MEITLVRHGKTAPVDGRLISGRELGDWVKRYNEVGITRELAPPQRVQQLAASARCVLASDLRRSIESAQWLASQDDVQIDRELREAVLPDRIGPSLRLPPKAWVVIARVAWWLDWCQSSETKEATRQRASRVADRLSGSAAQHGAVLVVGHGTFNRFIATQLLSRGWRGPRLLSGAYWAASRFVRVDPESRPSAGR